MLQRNGQIPNPTMLHQMVHSTSATTRTRISNRKRTVSESTSSDSECERTSTDQFADRRPGGSFLLVETSISTPMDFEDQLDRQSKELITIVHQAFKDTLEVKGRQTIERVQLSLRRTFPSVRTPVTRGHRA